MSLLLHLSDTHFGTEQAPVVAALQALARERRPDVLVFSGDVTQRARADQFAAAGRFCESLGIARRLVLPGNHDIPVFNLAARLWQPYAGYRKVFGASLEPVIDTAGLLVIGVNTTRPARHKNGEVSLRQVSQVAHRLQGARPDQLRVVVTHQPAAVARVQDEHDRLRGAEAALQAWSRAGADLVLGGHIHLPYVLDLRTLPAPVPRAMWCVQAGTAVSARVRHGSANSVNLVHWSATRPGEPRNCCIERCDYDAGRESFATATRQVLELAS
ncbi:metallophosphoesterase [uncultured Ramlibacter sp.]|uniref:metallophosphoesterase family protein n=1 Tax=uncultured Ramlibacter sp. TaxID=260755 RepID=UPI002606F4DF|nr:metallophosphoesterase [uncultured Ramlibacter sp.]